MRITVRLDERLHRQAKELAARERRTLSSVLDEALRLFLGRRSVSSGKGPAKLITFGGGGLRPGVDLDNTAALLDLMDAGKPVDKLR